MKIIDRYLLKQFLRTFAIWFVTLMGLYVIFDFFSNMEEFVNFGKKSGGLLPLVVKFYSYRSVEFFNKYSPLLTLVSAMFTVAWIQRSNELTALMAAGISKLRVVTPIICAAIGITVLAAACREMVIPKFRDQLTINPQQFDTSDGREMQVTWDNRTDILLRGEKVFREENRISNPNFLLPKQLSHYGKYLQAADAIYEDADRTIGRPRGYRLVGVLRPENLNEKPSLQLDGEPIVITPMDAQWLKPDECFVASDISFDQLTTGQLLRQYSSTATLIKGLRNPSLDYGTDVRSMIHNRFVQPLLDITLLFLGLPLVLRRSNRNVFAAMGLAGVLVIAFFLIQLGCQQFGTFYAMPAFGAWLPLMIFVPIAVGMFESMRT